MALKLHRNPPLLAYLSACSTGSTGADDLADEGLHLMSACQLVGFRYIVGSLWAVSDRHCVDVAQTLYATMVAGRWPSSGLGVTLTNVFHRSVAHLTGINASTYNTRDIFHIESILLFFYNYFFYNYNSHREILEELKFKHLT